MAQTIKLKRSATSGAIPTTSSLALGEVAINTYDGKMYIKKDVGGTETVVQVGAGSVSYLEAGMIEYEYTATSNQTSFSGSDDNSATLSYIAESIMVFVNGVLQDDGVDYTASNGTSVVFGTGLAAADEVRIVAFTNVTTTSTLQDPTKLDAISTVNNQAAYSLTLASSAYTPSSQNALIVSLNGITQEPGDSFTISGSTITFSPALVTGDVIDYIVDMGRAVTIGEYSGDLAIGGELEVTGDIIGDLRGSTLFKAQAGEALSKGSVVYISGISGNTTVVSKADANDAAKMPSFGVAAEAVSANNPVDIYTFGPLSGIDTSSYSEGEELFVSNTAGVLTATPPAGEASKLQKIAKVTRSHASAGSIFIMGAGRSNAVPNLDDGDIFIGNASNQAVSASLNTKIEDYLDAGTSTPTFSSANITNTSTGDSLLITTTEDTSTAAPVITLKRNSSSPADGDYLGQLKFKGENDADQEVVYAKVTGKISDASDTTEDGLLEFALRKAGSNNIGMRLTSTDLRLINGTGLEVAGDATITGNLTVNGTTTTINSTTMTVDDLNLTLASGAANAAAANGAGITVDGASATLTYNSTPDAWSFNKNVGIGIDSPTEKLTVRGDVTLSPDSTSAADRLASLTIGKRDSGTSDYMGKMEFVGSGTNGFATDIVFSSKTGDFYNSTTNEHMRIDSGGKVRIGDTTTAPKPDALVHLHKSVQSGNVPFGDEASQVISTNSNVAGVQGYLGSLFFGSQDVSSATQYAWKAAGIAGYMAGDLGTGGATADLLFYTANASQTPTERMRITSSGDVGIGTTAPASKLEVAGETRTDSLSVGEISDHGGIVGPNTSMSIPQGTVQYVTLAKIYTGRYRINLSNHGNSAYNAATIEVGLTFNSSTATDNHEGFRVYSQIADSGFTEVVEIYGKYVDQDECEVIIKYNNSSSSIQVLNCQIIGLSNTAIPTMIETFTTTDPSLTNREPQHEIIGSTTTSSTHRFRNGNDLTMSISGNKVGIGQNNPALGYTGKLVVSDGVVGGYSYIDISNDNDNQFLKVGINSNNGVIAVDNDDVLTFGHLPNAGSNTLTERMRIDASGNLLVGKNNPGDYTAGFEVQPAGAIVVYRTSGVAGLFGRTDNGEILRFTSNGAIVGRIGVVNSDRMYFATADGLGLQFDKDNNRIVPCDAAGAYNNNVELGDSSLEFTNLWLSGTANIGSTAELKSGTNGTTAALRFVTTDNVDTSKFIRMSSYYMEYSGNSNEGHHFVDSASTSLLKVFGNTNSGYPRRIGMGTETPSGKLHVATGLEPNNVYFTAGASGGTGYDVSLNLLGGANNSEMLINLGIDGDADRNQIKSYQGNLYTRVNNSQRAEINGAGKHTFWGTHQGDSVGHFLFTNQGFDSATVNNSLVVQNGYTFLQFMAWTSNGARIGTRTSGWSATGSQVTYLVSADATFAYGSGANFYLANGTAITSDERLKKNIVSTPDGQLAKINALRPVSFDWKDERKDSGEGFIAQEVEAIIPEAVAESEYVPDPDDDTRDFEGNVKSIKDGVLLSRLVKAIQELNTKLDAAEARITELEG